MKRSTCGWLFVCLLITSLPSVAHSAEEPTALAQQAQDVLKAHCKRCHSADGKAKGGLDYVTQLDRLVARGKVVPGRASESEIFQRIRDGDMPPKAVKERPTKDELASLEQWIEAGAPATKPASPPRLVSESDVVRAVRADLESLPEHQRRFARYFTLAPLANAGRPEEELESTRHGLAKLINCLSWHPRVTRPVAVDPSALLFRIDLRDYKWNGRLWDRLVAAYPYKQTNTSTEAKEAAGLTGSEQPHLRADWFIATASRAPLYYDLLQMPGTAGALERSLQVDAAADIQEASVARAGFNGSGVSKNNRILERHDAGYGAYWRTYDFSDNIDKQNIFDHPLGPPPAINSFVPAGGESIFHLPNGLHGYLLLDGNGRRVDKASVEIVSDPQRPDRAVEAGLSCMSCHGRGFIHKADQVRAHVLKNAAAFTREQVETVKAIYPKEARFHTLIDQDNERYLKALTLVGIPEKEAEPITATTLRYEAVVDLALAAGEAGLPVEEFQARLAKSSALNRSLGALQVKGGTVQRQTFQTAFTELVRELALGDAYRPSTTATRRHFAGHSAEILCIDFSPNGSQAVSGSEDKTLRLWDVDSGKELRRFEGHTAAVTAVAFVDSGKILSGSADRTIRLWDVETGKELKRLEGHTDKITFIAVGVTTFASGDQSGTIRMWDQESGKERYCLTGHTGAIRGLAYDPYGGFVASGGEDGTVRTWVHGKEKAKMEGHKGPVLSVYWGESGRVYSGGNDHTVRIWDNYKAQELQCLEGHANAVIRVFQSRTDKSDLISGSSQYQTPDRCIRRWNLEKGKETAAYGGENKDRVSCMTFSRDGKRALTDGPENTLRLWQIGEAPKESP